MKAKRAYPLDFKTIFGVSTMGFLQTIATSLMTSMLMLYVTDYSGIYAGIAGKAASAATVLLLVGRLWDTFNDPLFGIVMDRSRRTRWGKFKPYMFGGTLAAAILIVLLFNIPGGFSDPLKVAWLYVIYIVFEVAFSLLPMTPLTVSLSDDAQVRTKLLVYPRISNMIIAIPISFFLAIATMLGKDGTPNIGLGVLLFTVPTALISLLGIALIKEGRSEVNEGKVQVRDIFRTYANNKPLLISLLSGVFSGFIFTFLMAAITYYIKYAFGAENLGTQSAVWGGVMLLGILAGTFLAQAVQKRTTPAQCSIVSNAIAIVPLAVLWLVGLAGPIRSMYVLYPLLFLSVIGVGMSYIPGSLITMECMDYNKFKIGKSMEGLVSTSGAFVMKLQSAVSSTVTGAILIAVGYNAELYKDAATIPDALFSGLGIVLFALPVVFGLLAIAAMWFYPLRRKVDRDRVYEALEQSKSQIKDS